MYLLSIVFYFGVASVGAIPRDVLYPKGTEQGDNKLPVDDDTSSAEIHLQIPISFYDESFSSIYVNMNGMLSFGTNIELYRADLVLPIGHRVIAPFLADVDIRLSGDVYYRETRDPSLLDMAAREIHPNFPRRRNFQPKSLFIVTWDHVGYFNKQYDRTNTFQVVIASDGVDSFVIFLYPEISWIRGQGKGAPIVQDVPAQAGFDAGDNRRHYVLPGSGNEYIRELARTSNAGVPGVWMFRIGALHGGDIETPGDHSELGLVADEVPGSCAAGGERLCNINAKCVDYPGGYCCECLKTHIGNGINCIQPEIQMRVNGRVTGTVNGVRLEEANLHAFLMFKDGRVYIAISKVSPELGYSMQGLYAFAGGLGWLLAIPTLSTAKNGYQITGGDFNRTAVIRFVDSGETIKLEQVYKGQNAEGHMDMHSVVNGNIPKIRKGAQVVIPDYKDEFRRTRPGEIKSFSTHTFTVDDVPVHFTVDQTLRYTECTHKPPNGEAVQRLAVSRTFIHFDDNEQQIVRYAQSNRLVTVVDSDPCRESRQVCSPYADCVPERGSYRCLCKEGYTGDGLRCQDVDECRRNTHDCHQFAVCHNTEGSYQCQCRPGYRGDGRHCEKDDSAGQCDLLQCDPNADCIFDEYLSRYTCQCRAGFVGDGYVCETTRDCSIYNYCDRNARCLPTPYGEYRCVCSEGYEGDGTKCREASCNVINNCDINADCLYDPISSTYQCQCRQGYTGDGFSCRLTADCRRDPGICDPDARCESSGYDYICVCNPGYRGDGYRCAPVGDGQSYLLIAQGMTIMQMPFTPSDSNPGKPVLTIPGQTAIGIDVDCFARYFYWTDVAGQVISRAKLDGTDSEVLVSGLGSPEGVAIDWINGHMYWTDSGLDTIEVSNTDGTSRKTLIDKDLHDPRGIVVDPISGVMFWTDWYRKRPVLERASMDGTQRRVLVEERLGLPNGLTIDFGSHHICWVDAGTHEIECVNYEGSGRRSIYTQADYPFDITYTNHIFYWTDWHKKTLQSINKFSSDVNHGLEIPAGGHGRLYGIALVKGQCPAGTNACALNNGGCRRFMCLPTPNGGRTCACPDDIDQDECNIINRLV